MLVAVAILGTLALLGRVGVQLINNMMQASAVSKVQQEAQLVLYNVTKDVRNSMRIVSASSTTLVLNSVNTSQGFDVTQNTNLFADVNVSTLTYHFVSNGGETYLRKTLERNGVTLDDKKMLKNLLIAPDNTNHLFVVCRREGMLQDNCPLPGQAGHPDQPTFNIDLHYGVDIRFKMSPLFVKDSEVEYSAREIRRSNSL
jgi:hypothetical protein